MENEIINLYQKGYSINKISRELNYDWQQVKDRLNEMIEKNSYLEKELSELKSQMLTLTMNICLDLTCKRRITETAKSNNKESSKQKE